MIEGIRWLIRYKDDQTEKVLQFMIAGEWYDVPVERITNG